MSSSTEDTPETGTRPTQNTKTATAVDMGEDLLESTDTLQVAPSLGADAPGSFTSISPSTSPSTSNDAFDSDDQLASAKILLNEGLVEDAKRILRDVLKRDSHHVGAKKKLEEIHQLELKKIFGDEPGLGPQKRRKPSAPEMEVEQVIENLERDLDLAPNVSPTNRLFDSPEAQRIFIHKLESDLSSLEAQDRLDVGIAFLEMELFEVALAQFKPLTRHPDLARQATGLAAQALIEEGRPYEAAIALEPWLVDTELSAQDRVDFQYWMGLAMERLERFADASTWYARVAQVNPHHRDVEERIRKCEKGRS